MKYIFIILVLGLSSCQTQESESDLSVFTGKWEVTFGETIINEEWGDFSDSEMHGVGYTVVQADTNITEKLRIFRDKKGWIYEALVFNQNDALPIGFRMTSHEKGTYIFENPDHDYPKIIRYMFSDEDIMNVTIGNETLENEEPVIYKRTD